MSGSFDRTLKIWNAADGTLLKTLSGHARYVQCVAALGDDRVVSGSCDGTARVWDCDSGECVHILRGHSALVTCMSVLSNEQTLVTGSFDHTLEVWGHVIIEERRYFIGPRGPRLVLRRSGQRLGRFWKSFDCTLRVWDVEQARCLSTLKGHRDRVWCVVALSRCRVASGSLDRTLRVWDCVNGTCLGVLQGHSREVRCVVSLKDDVLASSGDDRSIKVWDLTDYKCRRTLNGHGHFVTGLAVLADGRLASASHDRTLKIWDALSGRRLATLAGHAHVVERLAVLPGGRLASGSHDRWKPASIAAKIAMQPVSQNNASRAPCIGRPTVHASRQHLAQN